MSGIYHSGSAWPRNAGDFGWAGLDGAGKWIFPLSSQQFHDRSKRMDRPWRCHGSAWGSDGCSVVAF